MKLLTIILTMLLLVNFATAVTTDKAVYEINEEIKIRLAPEEISGLNKLVINNGAKYYQYNNRLEEQVTFKAPEAGTYEIAIRSPEGETSTQIEVKEREIVAPIINPDINLETDKQAYFIGEQVIIFLDKKGELTINGPENTYKLLHQSTGPIEFTPKSPGEYEILFEDRGSTYQKYFVVINKEFDIVKEAVRLKNEAGNIIPYTVVSQEISGEQSLTLPREYLLEVRPEISSVKKILLETQLGGDEIILQEHFIVEDNIKFFNAYTINSDKLVKVKNVAKGNQLLECDNFDEYCLGEWKFKTKLNPGEEYEIETQGRKTFAEVNDLEKPTKKEFVSVKLTGLNDTNSTIKVKKIIEDKRREIFEINPEDITFTSGKITKVAKGNELKKCSEWNIITESCMGIWEKVKDINPGEEYEIDLNDVLSVYAEFGVATVNTKKPTYHLGELAELIMVVLDTEGYLVSGAEVYLNVTTPNNETIEVSGIRETSTGVYEAIFDETNTEGVYHLSITALQNGLSQSMESFFLVKSFYEFDIVRDSPVTIDPRYPFDSSINIEPFININTYDFTEVLPSDFTIVNDGGAEVSYDSSNYYLTWHNLSNLSTVSYIADAPDIIPNVEVLGESYISYLDTQFFEARQWFLAIDPNINTTLVNESFESTSPLYYDAAGNWTASGIAAIEWDRETGTSVCGSAAAHVDGSTGDDPTATTYLTLDGGLADLSDAVSAVVRFQYWCDKDMDDGETFSYDEYYNGGWNDDVLSVNLGPCTEGWVSYERTLPGSAFYSDFTVRFAVETSTANEDFYLDCFEIIKEYTPNSPPTWSNINKNATSVNQYDYVYFNTTWTDSDGPGLDSYIFSTNDSGSWVNSSPVQFTSNNLSEATIQFNASSNSLVGWRFFANDSSGEWNSTPIQTFSIADASDFTPPSITSETVAPSSGITGTLFNISATVTDAGTLNTINAEIHYPDGTVTNYSMSNSGSTYYFELTALSGGNYSAYVIAVDSNGNRNTSSVLEFNVTSNSSVDKYYYDRGETVYLTLDGFVANNNVSIDIKDDRGVSVSGYPATVLADSSGSINYEWNVSTSTSFRLGVYNITATDEDISWLSESQEVMVILKSDTALRYDDNGQGVDVLSETNETDNTDARIRSSQNEDYIQFDFNNTVATGYDINAIDFYVEHQEVATYSMYIDVLDAGVWTTACTISASLGSESFDSCNLSAYITSNSEAQNIGIRVTDGDGIGNNVEWSDVDFVYLYINFTLSSDTTVTIIEPVDTANSYNFSDSNNKAYDGGSTAIPPTAITTGTEASGAEYTALTDSDNDRMDSLVTGNTNEHVYQSYNYKLTQAVSDLSNIEFVYEGYATARTDQIADDFHIYIWNNNTGAYNLQTTVAGDTQDIVAGFTILSGLSDYIDANGNVWILVEGDHATTGGLNAQADLHTDEATLIVNEFPVLTGLQNITAEALDLDGISICSYAYRGATGYTGMSSIGSDLWRNESNTAVVADGFYYIDVLCNDTGTGYGNDSIYVRIDNSAPTVNLVSPQNYSNFTVSAINFTWNGSDNGGGQLSCDVFINGVENTSDVLSNNGVVTTYEITGFPTGYYNWSVTCADSGGAYNNSQTWDFRVDTDAPSITLDYLPNNFYGNISSVNFQYTPTDYFDINQCQLFVNQLLNSTNTSISNGLTNYFNNVAVTEGYYNWTVGCSDEFGNIQNATPYSFTVDQTPPTVYLNVSSGYVFNDSSVTLNYTVVDNLDSSLWCNLTISDGTNDNNIASLNNTLITRPFTLGDGTKYWNVTCWDDGGLSFTSETRNFSVSGPPTVTLISPANNLFVNGISQTFIYYTQDGDGISSCDFYWDGTYNQTNSTGINNGENNNFTLTNIAEGLHTWQVMCNDTAFYQGNSSIYNLTVDSTPPNIQLFNPSEGENLADELVTLNFTVTDNLDSTLRCNLTVDGSVSTTNNNFVVLNGTVHNLTETIYDGSHNWSVTCWDGTSGVLNSNTSATNNFSVSGSPQVNLVSPGNNTAHIENVTFVYFAGDTSGLANCSLFIDGIYNQSNATGLNNYSNNNFTLNNIGQGYHNWSVQCFDNGGENTTAGNYSIYIDTQLPTVTSNYPNGQTYNSDTVEFNWTVTDDYSSNFICSIYINDSVADSGISAPSGDNLLNLSGISDGPHSWYASCVDDAGLNGTSGIKYFTIDAAPTVYLDSPANNNGSRTGDVIFTYEVYEGSLNNCSLYINGALNQTNTSAEIPHVNDGLLNNFTINNMQEGYYNWTVSCYDTNGFEGQADDGEGNQEIRNLWVDFNNPWVELNTPIEGQNISFATVTFNFTAYDEISDDLTCDLFVNEVLNTTGITAPNNVSTTVEVPGFSAGSYNWSVTCYDYSAYSNNTETRNFTINPLPSVSLYSPENGSTKNTSTFDLFYTASDLEGLSFCDLYWDGVYNNTKVAAGGGVVNGGISNFTITDSTEGLHNWSINCTDTDSNSAISQTWDVYIDLTEPWISLNYPVSIQVNESTVEFNYTAYDNLDTVLLCDFQADDGNYTNTGVSSTNATPVTFSFGGFNDGSHSWNVSCWDEGLNYNVSNTASFTVQEVPKIDLIAPANNNRTNIVDQNFTYLPTDNSNEIASCELIVNAGINQTNSSITEGVNNNFTISNMANGAYSWSVNCTDPSSNENSSETRTLIIDLLGPNINLSFPTEGQFLNQEDINFTWNATDTYSSSVSCSIYLDGALNASGLPGTSGEFSNYTIYGLGDGPHNWSITCLDDLGNSNSSVLGNFTINSPDFATTNGNLTFNDTNPDLNENISIELTVYNIGGVSDNAYVEFWDGPLGTGTYMGNATELVEVNGSVQFNVSWVITSGYHNINAFVDPYNTRFELNETNNNASVNISVLWAEINNPPSETFFSSSPQNVNFTLHDYTNNMLNYTIFVNGAAQLLGNVSDNLSFVDSVALFEGLNLVQVEALDSLGRRKNSTAFNYYLDTTAPVVTFNESNYTWFNSSLFNISFNITDNLDSNINYTIYLGGSFNESNNISNGGIRTKSFNLSDGLYNITVEAFDDTGNIANYTLMVYVDTTDPTVNLTTPLESHIFNIRDVLLNYTVTDNLGNPLTCSLYVGASLEDVSSVLNGTNKSVSVTGLAESGYTWYSSCYDNATNTGTSEVRNFSVFIAPEITLIAPEDNHVTNNNTLVFTFNASDETGLENCSLLIDGSINDTKTGGQLNNGGYSNFTVNGLSGNHNWAIQCYDNTTEFMYNISENRSITVDTEAPVPTILTQNNTWFNSQPDIDFNITDDVSTVINYTVYVDGIPNIQGSVNNNTNTNVVLSGLTNGSHSIIVEGFDEAGNYDNSTPITVWVDTVLPSAILYEPSEGSNITTNSVNFNFSVSDNLAPNMTFYLYVDDSLINSSSILNNTLVNQTFSFSAGNHDWYINVTDLAGNTYMSERINFTIVPPDLTINTGNITFNTSTGTENDNVTIYANVWNIGDTDAGSFTVQFYYGNPDSGGTQFGGDRLIASLSSGSNITLNASYVLPIGDNNIYVLVDTPLATNGSINEDDETNNKAFNSLSVGLWHFISGNSTDNLVIDDLTDITLYDWLVSNSSGSNIFAADVEASISFSNLTALSRDTGGTYQGEDFYELDVALGSENLTDSVNSTYTTNSNPILTGTYEVLGNTVVNVPEINSTNNSNFLTGIMWDANDGNTEYNGTQDVIFISEINKQKQGRDGIVDFEIRIPALLRQLDNTESTTAYLYTEIK